jgi:transcriptional regulator with GAF, ATPase, and Fis domain
MLHTPLIDAKRWNVHADADTSGSPPRVRSIAEGLDRKSLGRGHIVGQSAAWKDVLTNAMQVAATHATVLLQGDSGTGKEVVARFIHRASPRKDGPFVAINCAALPETLLESELFGYERGAFTGAQQSKPGQIELASAGVLFLDEVSEMSPAAQAKFLRVLQEREFLRLGGTRLVKTNARVIAATNRDLHAAMESGDFREDLYYRLRVFDIRIPPLRERPDDIVVLTDAFLQDLGHANGCQPAGISDEVRRMLSAHNWPGNVRELRNVLERATILCGGDLITPKHVDLHSAPSPPSSTGRLDEMVRRRIEQSLHETAWNIAKSARGLGLTRTQMYVRIKKYHLKRPDKRREMTP